MSERENDDAADVDAQVREWPGEKWHVFHTLPRAEKKAAAFARSRGAHVYLPLLKRTHQYGNRTRTFEVPVFSGYVFSSFPEDTVQTHRVSPYVARILPVSDDSDLLAKLAQLESALSDDAPVDVLPFVKEGEAVLITHGPFRGVEAKVVELESRKSVVIEFDMLDQMVAMSIETVQLGPLT